MGVKGIARIRHTEHDEQCPHADRNAFQSPLQRFQPGFGVRGIPPCLDVTLIEWREQPQDWEIPLGAQTERVVKTSEFLPHASLSGAIRG